MSRLVADRNAVLGLSLANLGLFLASGMLLAFIVGGLYGGFWERSAELHSTAESLNTYIETLSASYDETKIPVTIPKHPTIVLMTSSTQYLHITTKGSYNGLVSVTERWRVPLWPRSNGSWRSGDDLHRWLNETSHHSGSAQDPVNTSVLENVTKDQQTCARALAQDPVTFDATRPLIVEKVIVYGGEGEKVELLLIYQNDLENISEA